MSARSISARSISARSISARSISARSVSAVIRRGAAALALLWLAALVGASAAARVLPYAGEIAYMVYDPINPDIFLHDVGRGARFNLTDHPAYDGAPAWSPDGRWLAFISDREGGVQVFVMDANGGRLRRITDGNGTYGAPRWSANGDRLVFLALHEGATSLYTARPDGSDLQLVTSDATTPGEIMLDLGIQTGTISRSSSPDRTQIMYLSYRDGIWGIYVANPDRSGERLLTTISTFSEMPVWSPDGGRVVFSAWADGTADLFVVEVPPMPNSAPLAARRLTRTRAIDSSPAWRP